jgi:hypothetical protein
MIVVTVDRCPLSGKEGFPVSIPDNAKVVLDKNVTENGVTVIQVCRISDNVRIGKVSRITKLYVSDCPECDGTAINPTSTSTAVSSGATASTCVDCDKPVIPVVTAVKLSAWKRFVAWLKGLFK